MINMKFWSVATSIRGWIRMCATSLSLITFLHWRRKGQPPPVFLPGESQGRGSLVGCRLWGRTESNVTEATQQQRQHDCVRKGGGIREELMRIFRNCYVLFHKLGWYKINWYKPFIIFKFLLTFFKYVYIKIFHNQDR